jgi:hypothetical protein
LFWSKKVSVGLARAAAEGTEFAADKTDVSEINVAIHNVGNDVAGEFDSQAIRSDQQGEKVVTLSVREKHTLLAAN